MNSCSTFIIRSDGAAAPPSAPLSLPKKKRPKSKAGKTHKEKRAEALDPRMNRPLNRFNLYYILERERLLQSNAEYRPGEADGPLSPEIITGYEGMAVPELPSRYRHLTIAPDWWVPGKRKHTKRTHKKTHGLISFKEIARTTSDSWKVVDDETHKFVTELARLIAVRYKEIEHALGGPLPNSGFGGRRRSTASSMSTCDSLTPSQHHQQSNGQLPGLNPASDQGYSSLDSSSRSGWGNGPVTTSGEFEQLAVPEGRLNLDDVDGFWEGSGDVALPENHHHHQGVAGVAHDARGILRRASVGHSAGAAAERQAQQQQQMLHGSTIPSMSSTGMLGRMGARRLSLPDFAGLADNSQTSAGAGGGGVPLASGEIPNGPSMAQLARQVRQAHGLARSMPAATMTTIMQHDARIMGLQHNHQAVAALGAGVDASDRGNLYHLDTSGHRSLHGGGNVQPVPRHALRHSVSLPVQMSVTPSTTAMISQTSLGDGQFSGSNAAWTRRGEGSAPVAYAPKTSASGAPPPHHHRLFHSAPATRNPSPMGRLEVPTSPADPSSMMFCQIASDDSQSAGVTSLPLSSLLGQATFAGGVNMEAHPPLTISRDSGERKNDLLQSSSRSSSADSFENLLHSVGDGGLGSAGAAKDDFLRMFDE